MGGSWAGLSVTISAASAFAVGTTVVGDRRYAMTKTPGWDVKCGVCGHSSPVHAKGICRACSYERDGFMGPCAFSPIPSPQRLLGDFM